MRVYCPNCGSDNEGMPGGRVTCHACTMSFEVPRVEAATPQPTGPVAPPALPPPPGKLGTGPTFSGSLGGLAAPGPSGPPPQGFGVGRASHQGQLNPLAIASLVLGIVCCIPFSGIGAVVLGVLAKNQIDASNGQQRGRELALAGMVLGVLSMSLSVLSLFAHFTRRF